MIAQTAPSGTDPLEFLKYGVLGLVILAMLMGWLWSKPAVDRIIADKDKAEAQRDRMLDIYETKIIPALTESTQTDRDLKPVLEDVVSLVEELRDELHAAKRKGTTSARRS